MSKRPLCIGALVYVLVIACLLLIDTLGLASLPLTTKESMAASLINNNESISVTGKVYKQEEKNEQLLLYIKHVYLKQGSKKVKANNVIIYTNHSKAISIGNQIEVIGKSKKFQKPSNLGQFNSYLYYKSQNIDFGIQAMKLEIIDTKYSFIQNTLSSFARQLGSNFDDITKNISESGTFKAMVLGDKSDFTADIKELYQKGGILHAFCVSGLHIGIIGMFLFHILRKCGLGYKTAGSIGIVIVICYANMTGFGVSACRAMIMFIVAMLARMLGRTYDILSAVALAAILVLMENPLYLVNTGFLLSFGAMLGIGAVTPILIKTIPYKSGIIKAFLSSLGVTVVTLPIILSSYYEFPTYSILLNLVVLPIMSYVLLSGILGCLCAEFSVSLGSFMIGMGSYILRLYEALCNIAKKLPFSTIVIGKPLIVQIVIYYVLLIMMLYLLQRKEKKRYLLIVIFMIGILTYRMPNEFTVTFLDVGQGDGIVIQSVDGTNYMIDGGSTDVRNVGKYRILPYLKSNGIKKLDYCILTHPDEDHKSGLIEIINSDYKIDNLILPDIGMKDDAFTELEQLAKESGIHVFYFSKGNKLTKGGLELECLHPYKEYGPESRNDYSTVLSLRYGELDMLLTGDIETKGEKEITEIITKDYDILKVAHHGSKNSTSKEFLDKINAEYAIISCGENNRYGHPHQELLQRLEASKMEVMITKDVGAITIKVKGKELEYSGYKGE